MKYAEVVKQPNYLPPDALLEPHISSSSRAWQHVWETIVRLKQKPYVMPFDYMDRVSEDCFVGRYNHGTCPHVTDHHVKIAYEHVDVGWQTDSFFKRRLRLNEPCPELQNKNHAYMATITPDSVNSICLHCRSELDGCSYIRLDKALWNEKFDGRPRRATDKEMRLMGLDPLPTNCMTYLDQKGNATIMGRVRCGSCPACSSESAGGQHECVIHYIGGEDHWKYPTVSYCIYCGERWYSTPEGWSEACEDGFDISVDECLAQHEADKAAGLY